MKKLLATLLAMTSVCGAYAANYTWTVAGTPNEDGSLNWSDSANWSATAPAYPGPPAIDAGDNLDYTADSIDLAGEPRVRGFGSRLARADLGCHESPHMPGRLLIIVR